MENKIELVCPECNEKFNVDIFTSINVQMDKDMKNRVLSGKLFDMECTHCHSKFHIPYPDFISRYGKEVIDSIYRRKRTGTH